MTTFVDSANTTYPFRAVALITATFGDGYTQTGSGAVVGANDILTASHMVWSAARGTATKVTVAPGYNNGASPFGSYDAKLLNYYLWDTNRDGLVATTEGDEDIAILGFSERLIDKTGSFSIDPGYLNGDVHVTGYPGKYRGANGLRLTDDTGSGYERDGLFRFNADVEVNPGNSGGPVWYQGVASPYIVGVVSTAIFAADLSTHWQQIQSWISSNDYLMPALTVAVPDHIFKVARLYEASLSRKFDSSGLNNWINQYENGMSFTEMARQFLDSQEFTNRFGDDDLMPNETFVTRMYLNVLHRIPDGSGYKHWTSTMDAGMSREQVLLNFSESTENLSQSTYLSKLHQLSSGTWDI
jgi:V8-like Glu-specific endopeptidase